MNTSEVLKIIKKIAQPFHNIKVILCIELHTSIYEIFHNVSIHRNFIKINA
jgi:hypothetical protein